MALGHEKVGHTNQGLWHHKGMQLPAYVQHVANDLIQSGHPESDAVHMAVGIIQDWARGGGKVTPETRAKAAAALAEWEKLRAQAHAMTSAKRADMPDGEHDSARKGKGSASRAGTPYAPAQYTPDPGDDTAKCPACGKMNDPDARHCDQCGAAMQPSQPYARDTDETVQCPACAKYDDPDARFCDQCGAKLEGRTDVKVSRVSLAGSPAEIFRMYPLEDCRIVTRAQGDGSGTLVEAYATVFDEAAEIHDFQGHYSEVIDRSAFDDVLSKIRRSKGGFPAHVKVLYNHGKTAEGAPAPEYQVPLGVPEDIVPERRGLLTRTKYDPSDPFTERILGKIRSGAINTQSFVGGIIRSDPSLMGPGDKYRKRGGSLTTVRRMVLGLREYGPVLWPAYSGAEILGVRMQLPGSFEDDPALDDEPGTPGDDEYAPEPELAGVVAGAAPAEADTSRYHQHALYRIRSAEIRERIGLDWD